MRGPSAQLKGGTRSRSPGIPTGSIWITRWELCFRLASVIALNKTRLEQRLVPVAQAVISANLTVKIYPSSQVPSRLHTTHKPVIHTVWRTVCTVWIPSCLPDPVIGTQIHRQSGKRSVKYRLCKIFIVRNNGRTSGPITSLSTNGCLILRASPLVRSGISLRISHPSYSIELS